MALFSNYVPFKTELDRYLSNCKKVFADVGDRQSAALVDGFLQDFGKQRFCITIMGSLKRGKSTLLNTLMERSNDDISPIASEVCTSAIVKYLDKGLATDNSKEHAVIYFEASGKSPLTIPLARLRDYVTEECNPENRKGVRSVEVFGDFPPWSKAVAIVDSPGQNAVYDYHDALLQDFLPYTDALIFLIAADMPIDGGDMKLLAELAEEQKKKIFFVITKADRVEDSGDLDAVRDRVESILGEANLPFDKVYCISAKPVFEKLRGGCKGEELDNVKYRHGILELEQDLEKFIVRESNETKVFAERVRTILEMTSSACSRYIDNSQRMLSRAQIDIGALKNQEADLLDQNEELRRKLKESLKKFDRDWSRTVSQVQRKFAVKANVVSDRISDEIANSKGGFIGVVSKSFTLKKTIQRALNNEVQTVIDDLETKLDSIVRTLDSECSAEVDFYFKKVRAKADVSGGVLGLGGTGALVGAAAWGVSTATAPVMAAKTAILAWHSATAAVAGAETAAGIGSVGLFPWLGHFFVGGGARAAAAGAKAAADTAAVSAIGAGVTALISVGTSLVVTLVAEKLLKIGLTKINEGRVSGIVESGLAEMEKNLCNVLENYRKSIAAEYTQSIEDLIADNSDKLESIRKVMAKDDPTERERISNKLQDVQKLLSDCVHVQKQLPMI